MMDKFEFDSRNIFNVCLLLT
uniref:Uncharacterized protein n=1 Tax=Rhizophora mucronata TaxID=61149 RepID=A0A2P2IKC0_RHIMU